MQRDADSGKLILELRGHQETVTSAQFSPDGLIVATGSDDGTARIWDISVAYADATALVTLLDQRIASLGVSLPSEQCELYFSSKIGTKPAECFQVVENPAGTN